MITITLTPDSPDTHLALARAIIRTVERSRLGLTLREDAVDTDADEETSATDLAAHTHGGDANAPAYDSHGFPWDARIHSEAKKTNKDGSWKKRRGVQDAEITRVENELRAAGAVVPPAPLPPSAVQGGFQQTVGTTTAPTPPGGGATVVPPAPPPPTAATPPAPAASGAMTFVTLMQKVTGLLTAGKLNQAEIVSACTINGVENLPALAQRPDVVPAVAAYLDALTAGR